MKTAIKSKQPNFGQSTNSPSSFKGQPLPNNVRRKKLVSNPFDMKREIDSKTSPFKNRSPTQKQHDSPYDDPSPYSEDNNLFLSSSDQSIPEDTNEDDISTQIELKRAYDECIDTLAKSNEEAKIIISEMQQLCENGVETQSVSFSNNKIKRDNNEFQKCLKKNRENYKFLIAQRNALISIDTDRSEPVDVSNAIFALQMENSLISETCSIFEVDSQELNTRISVLEKELHKNKVKTKKQVVNENDKIYQSKIDQFKDNIQLLKTVKTPSFSAKTNENDFDNINENYIVDPSLEKARGVNSMMRRFGYSSQQNFINMITQFEDISEKCSIIWPKLNGFEPNENIMRQFMNEMWEQAALNEQIQSLQFNIENVLRSAGVVVKDNSLKGLINSLREVMEG